jgi:hypothetical protein
VPERIAEMRYDPQTSGGMLISIAPDEMENLMAELEAAGTLPSKIGKVTTPKSQRIGVYPDSAATVNALPRTTSTTPYARLNLTTVSK